MPVQVCIDDSGSLGDGPVFVMAGWMGEAEEWLEFSEKWSAALNERPRIAVFKMRDAATFNNEFGGMSRTERDLKVQRLARIITEHAFSAVQYAVELDGYADTLKPEDIYYRAPYHLAFDAVALAVAFELLEREHGERVELIFDENMIFGRRAKKWYPLLRSVLTDAEREIMPVEPLFKSDDEFLPLQAADMIAWLFRRDWSAHASSFDWLVHEEFAPRVPLSPHSGIFTREALARVKENGTRMAKESQGDPARQAQLAELARTLMRDEN